MTDLPNLPEYPKVLVDGNAVVIHYENGNKEVWGYEPNEKLAKEIASDIETRLKAIDYVTFEIVKKLNEIAEQFDTMGMPKEYASEYICEGYSKVSRWFRELRRNEAVKE